MSKLFGIVAAATLFVSVGAFAQDAAPAPADAAKADKPVHRHAGHHHHMAGKAGTDENADKLNACMSNATPTSEQESCLKQASGSGNG